jgi:ATP-binding cassette subfamily F protein 3
VSTVVLENVSLSFGARPIVEDLSLRIAEGDRIGLIGPNGSGKTTLLKMVAGEQQPDSGTIRFAKGAKVGWLPQDIAVEGGRTLMQLVRQSVPGRSELERHVAEAEAQLAEVAEQRPDDADALAELGERLAHLHERLSRFDLLYSDHEAAKILAGLGFKPEDLERDVGEFSGGWKMRGVLAALLFQQPDVLLLDEPTNHLDMPSVAWFSEFLLRWPRAFVLISHDREFLNEQIRRVVTFETEGVRQYPGNYERYLVQRAEEEEILTNKAKNLEREKEKMEQFINRFRAQANKAKAVQSRVKALDKMDDVELYRKRRTMRFSFPEVDRAGHEVVRIEKVDKRYGTREVLGGVSLGIYRGDRIGIIGPNGAGKTTLLKMIASELPPSGGTIQLGHSVKPGYYAQHHTELLHPRSTVLQEATSANDKQPVSRIRSVLGAFLFSGDDVDKPISVLSGGERARVTLARLLIDPGNLLLLDEPTNHLDLDSCESLTESLAEYGGTMVFVSHNRSLVRRLATKIWVVEHGTVTEFVGSLDDYLARERQRLSGGEEKAKERALAKPETKSVPPAKSVSTQPWTPPAPSLSRDEEKAKKREEARQRELKSKKVGPLEKKVAAIEADIAKLEAAQSERNARLSDPAVSLTDAERYALLDGLQVDQGKLDELTEGWESAQAELDAAKKELGLG